MSPAPDAPGHTVQGRSDQVKAAVLEMVSDPELWLKIQAAIREAGLCIIPRERVWPENRPEPTAGNWLIVRADEYEALRQIQFYARHGEEMMVNRFVRELEQIEADPAHTVKPYQPNAEAAPPSVLEAMTAAADYLAELYAKYQLKIGPFASQAQKIQGRLRAAIASAEAAEGRAKGEAAVPGEVHFTAHGLFVEPATPSDCPPPAVEVAKALTDYVFERAQAAEAALGPLHPRERGAHPKCASCRGSGKVGIPGRHCTHCVAYWLADDFGKPKTASEPPAVEGVGLREVAWVSIQPDQVYWTESREKAEEWKQRVWNVVGYADPYATPPPSTPDREADARVLWRFRMHPDAFGGPTKPWVYTEIRPTDVRGMAELERLSVLVTPMVKP